MKMKLNNFKLYFFEKIFREVILECLKADQDHLVKSKGLELQALLMNKIDQVLKEQTVTMSTKKQILFRLQDKIPSLTQVYKVWNEEAYFISS